MKILRKQGIVELNPGTSNVDRIISRIWWGVQPAEVRGEVSKEGTSDIFEDGKDEAKEGKGEKAGEGNGKLAKGTMSLEILTQRNLIVWAILAVWGIYYFTLQFQFDQSAYQGNGWLFTDEPSVWLQGHRHVVLDYFLSYSWVLIFISVGSLYYLVALTAEKGFWRYGLAFWATWLTQYTLQMFVNLAPPIRAKETSLVFIREEVFPLSENLVGLKNGAFPSGHIGVTLLVFMIARDRGAPWIQKVALGCLVIMFWAILYLGEHYLVDAIASAILYPSLYLIMTRKVFPEEKGKDPKPIVSDQMSEI